MHVKLTDAVLKGIFHFFPLAVEIRLEKTDINTESLDNRYLGEKKE